VIFADAGYLLLFLLAMAGLGCAVLIVVLTVTGEK
jgi:hypothetical protein